MKFYTKQHTHYCGIDLHARMLYVCILDSQGETVVHKNIKANPEALLRHRLFSSEQGEKPPRRMMLANGVL